MQTFLLLVKRLASSVKNPHKNSTTASVSYFCKRINSPVRALLSIKKCVSIFIEYKLLWYIQSDVSQGQTPGVASWGVAEE